MNIEYEALRDFLTHRLSELDQLDELQATPAQFTFLDHWTQRKAA